MRRANPLTVGPKRCQRFRDGHRAATKACVRWLEERSREMNDPMAAAILRSASTNLGWATQHNKVPSRRKPKPEEAV